MLREEVREAWGDLKYKLFNSSRLGEILVSLEHYSLKPIADLDELELAVKNYKEKTRREIRQYEQNNYLLNEKLENKECRFFNCSSCEYCRRGPEVEEID